MRCPCKSYRTQNRTFPRTRSTRSSRSIDRARSSLSAAISAPRTTCAASFIPSRYGAELEVSPHVAVPSNFFLEILGIHDEIGCTLIRREEEKVTVGFNMLIDPEFLHHVVKLSFEF